MPISFNAILRSSGVEPQSVRLLRHQDGQADKDRTPYLLWRNYPTDFLAYQSRQSSKRARFFGDASYWAVFVVTPWRENLFAGLYRVGASKPAEKGARSMTVREGFDEGDDTWFEIEKDDRLAEYEGKLAIKWGSAALAWAQYAHKHDKEVSAVYPREPEPAFPGYLRLVMALSDVPSIYGEWQQRLRDVKGVYVLTSSKDKALYIGSAIGVGGFYERWCHHAKKGGDAVQFRLREPDDYQVSILEVAGSNASDRDIIHAEQLWMQKLQTREMGLNGGTLSEVGNKFAVSGHEPFYVIQKDGKEVQLVIGDDCQVKRVPVKIPRPSVD